MTETTIPNLNVTNYIENTERFWQQQPFFYDKAKIFWLWNKCDYKYEMVDDTDMLNKIKVSLSLSSDLVTASIKNDYLESFRRVGRQKIPKPALKSWIQFKNKIYDIEKNEFIDVSPEFFITNPIPWDIGESDDTPIMDRIFKEWVGEEYIQTLYEIIAYCILSSYPIHRLFCLIGAGQNGKGRFLALITKFLGQYNCTTTELDLLLCNPRFETIRFYKKLMCQMGETSFNEIKHSATIKRLTGEDLMNFELKHKNPFEDYNYAKIIIATNSLPVTHDKTVGFYRRWCIIDFPNMFTEKKDILKDIPEYEYNNLAKKSLKILKELMIKREFTNEGTIEDRTKKFEEKSNPLKLFIAQCCKIDPNLSVPYWQFKDKYILFLKDKGLREQSDTEIGRRLTDEGFEKKTMTSRNNCNTTWVYRIGLELLENLKKLEEEQKELKVEW